MKEARVQLGGVVRDRFGRVGIVQSMEQPPAEDWIAEQLGVQDRERLLQEDVWWGVMPLGGGYLLCADAELTPLRETSYEDFLVAADNANPDGRKYLALQFPGYVERLLRERSMRQA